MATEGTAALVERLDELARRRPRRDPRLPTLVVTGPGASEFVRWYESRLYVDGRPSVPSVLVDGPHTTAAEEDLGFFDKMADGLGCSLPHGIHGMELGRDLRLPRYWTVRHVLDATAPARIEAQRRRQLRDALHARRGEAGAPAGWLAPVAEWLDGVALGPVSGAVLVKPARAASRLLFGMRLRLDPRFRWFTRAVANVTGVRRPFLGAGLRLVEGGPDRDKAALVQRVLTQALLLDLQAATRFSLLSPFRRRRVTPFVAHLLGIAPGSAAHGFLDRLASVGPDDVRRHTLLVLATPAATPGDDTGGELTPPATPTYDPRDAAAALAPLTRRGEALSHRMLRVDVPDGPPSRPDQQRLQEHPVVQPMPVRWAVAVPVLTALAIVALVLWLIPWPPPEDPERCPDELDGEMIGIGDGTDGCSFFQGAADTPTEVDDAMAAVEAEIAHENARVEAVGDTHGTIVFFAPLTVPPGQGRQGENALNQLRGTALAQRRANIAAAGDPSRVYTRVLLANPGDRFAHGVDVARQIVRRAEADSTVIGVVGIGQSRGASRDAVRVLGDSRLPVVAGPVTGDDMVEASPHYYQVSARNLRIADMLVDFATRSEVVRTDGGNAVAAEGAVIVMDHSDEYSRNLAYNLHARLVESGGRGDSIVTLPVEDPGAPIPDAPHEGAPDPVRVGTLNDVAQQVCTSLGPTDIVFYTGRSQQFIGMLRAMRDDNGCPATVTVVGGSALTKVIEDPTTPLTEFPGVSLYYAAFAARGVEYGPASTEFVRRYDEAYGADMVISDISDGAVAFDAFNALQRTADYAVRNGLPISSDTSAGALGGEEIDFDGASGYIALGNGPINGEDARVPPDKPVLVLPATGDLPAGSLACGRFTVDTATTTWGAADHPCPTTD